MLCMLNTTLVSESLSPVLEIIYLTFPGGRIDSPNEFPWVTFEF